ncbi:CopG family transcriptional regulator [Rhizobium sp. 13T]|uniref:CopG family transcriptional regulator n=1 Tax=Rhizobium croatiense TaxID=2867516 RepID=A0ABS7M7C0_9HYPH|nr:CopG family transcriptional regulator [Rhizobium croatiense]MBY4632773.1 CopG family transcriptional regulator [Rhizobium croatiense]
MAQRRVSQQAARGDVQADENMEEALRNISSELVLTRDDAIRYIVREWMEKNTYLPVHDLDEDGDTDREA